MNVDIYFIPSNTLGKLAQMPCPSGKPSLRVNLTALKQQGIDTIVSLLEPAEAEALGLTDEGVVFESCGGNFINYPIADFCLPDDLSSGLSSDLPSFKSLAVDLADSIRSGAGVAIHCRAGIGRSTLLSCAVLVHLGVEVNVALQRIAHYRGLKVPDTDEQKCWLLDNFAKTSQS